MNTPIVLERRSMNLAPDHDRMAHFEDAQSDTAPVEQCVLAKASGPGPEMDWIRPTLRLSRWTEDILVLDMRDMVIAATKSEASVPELRHIE
jgi:hypothetical protein